jgi:AraC-like DNA-binding protein
LWHQVPENLNCTTTGKTCSHIIVCWLLPGHLWFLYYFCLNMATWKVTILLLAAAQGIMLSLALIGSGFKKMQPRLFLGLVLLVCGIELLTTWAVQTGYVQQTGAFPFWIAGSYLILPTALWFFIQTAALPGFILKKQHLLLFVPAAIEILTEMTSLILYRVYGAVAGITKTSFWFLFTEVLPLAGIIGVQVYYLLQLKKLGRAQQPANKTQALHLKRQYAFFLLFTVITVLWAAEAWLGLQVYSITLFVLCIALFVLGYAVYFQPGFFELQAVIAQRQAAAAFTNYDEEKELQRLQHLFTHEKIYRQPRLSVEDVAAQLNLPHRFISYLVNRHYHTNFNGFVNTCRVNEVLSRMQDPNESNKTLLGIALDSGFSSKSSFNHIFKTITGQTPSAFLAKKQE